MAQRSIPEADPARFLLLSLAYSVHTCIIWSALSTHSQLYEEVMCE